MWAPNRGTDRRRGGCNFIPYVKAVGGRAQVNTVRLQRLSPSHEVLQVNRMAGEGMGGGTGVNRSDYFGLGQGKAA